MNIEMIRELCLSFPGVTEDVKWGNNLVFSVAEKMFCLADLEIPLRVSFKTEPDEFVRLTGTPEIIQAPYFAKNMWVCVLESERFTHDEWQHYLRQSYELVKSKLPKKVRESLS